MNLFLGKIHYCWQEECTVKGLSNAANTGKLKMGECLMQFPFNHPCFLEEVFGNLLFKQIEKFFRSAVGFIIHSIKKNYSYPLQVLLFISPPCCRIFCP
jgi:hypothetical protein